MTAREDGLGLEVVSVQDLCPQDGAAERGAEDRTDTRVPPGRDGDPRVGRRQVESAREHRREPRTDLRGRQTLPAGRQPPDPIVTADATIFTRDARARMPRGFRRTASIAVSVPCPSGSWGRTAPRGSPISDRRDRPRTGTAQGRVKADPSASPSPAELGGLYPPITSRKNQLPRRIAWTKTMAPTPATAADQDTEDGPLLEVSGLTEDPRPLIEQTDRSCTDLHVKSPPSAVAPNGVSGKSGVDHEERRRRDAGRETADGMGWCSTSRPNQRTDRRQRCLEDGAFS